MLRTSDNNVPTDQQPIQLDPQAEDAQIVDEGTGLSAAIGFIHDAWPLQQVKIPD